MKAKVLVSFKTTVLDPQGQTIGAALRGRGYGWVANVRQGKVFDIDVADGSDPAEVRRQLEEIGREILANPVIEDFRVEGPE